MNRTIRAILGVIFVGIITFSAISISQNIGKYLKIDITDRKLYTLSEGTKSILSKVRQPIKMKLYYTKTAAMKGSDQIRYFNNYYLFVRSLLEEYSNVSGGMIQLEVIDPRPFTDDEADAFRYGLRGIAMSEDESFFFGLVIQTQFGVTRVVPFFSPDRENFIEYDISYLIDTGTRRQKQTIGVLSSLGVMGDEVSGYMAQMMRMQGQQPRGPWTIIEQLRGKYQVQKIKTDVEEITGVDILLVIHPKKLPEKTLFAIDQFVLKGGRAIVCIDPHCFADQPQRQMQMMPQPQQKRNSNLKMLLGNWGLEMPDNTFAGDRNLALTAPLGPSQRAQKIIGLLGLTQKCFNQENVVSANLNLVQIFLAGVLKETEIVDTKDEQVERTPLISTTARGNSWTANQFELMMPDQTSLMKKFIDGSEPVHMGYLVTGRFKSSFPEGIEIKDETDPNSQPRHLTGLAKASTDCAVAVFSDVDFISDAMAYRTLPLGLGKVPIGDNASLLLNTVDDLAGSADLISIRSRGNFRRPFTVVDRIEAEAEKETAEEERRINAEIASFQQELNKIVTTAQEDKENIIGSSILQKRKELESNLYKAQTRLRDVNRQKRRQKEKLGRTLRNLNTLPGPVLTLLVVVVLGLWRGTKKKHYISHASDA